MQKFFYNLGKLARQFLENKIVKKFLNIKNNISKTISELKSKNFKLSTEKKFSISYVLILFVFFNLIFSPSFTISKDVNKQKVSNILAEFLIAGTNYYLWDKTVGKKINYQFIEKNAYQGCINSTTMDKRCTGFRDLIGKNNINNFLFEDVDKNKDGKASVAEIASRFYSQKSNKLNNEKFKWDYSKINSILQNSYLSTYADTWLLYYKNHWTTRKHDSRGMHVSERQEDDLNGDFIVSKEDLKKFHFVKDILHSYQFAGGILRYEKVAKDLKRNIDYWKKAALEKKEKKSYSSSGSSSGGYSSRGKSGGAYVKGMFMSCPLILSYAQTNTSLCNRGLSGQCSHANLLWSKYRANCQ